MSAVVAAAQEGAVPVNVNTFVKNYVKALEEGNAAIFAGAGLSKPSGYVDWKTLMKDIVAELQLHPDTENLVAAAQYHVNERGTRGHLNQVLIDEFTKDAEPNSNHRLIARLPIETIWTTNYDTLIEQALAAEYKRADVKHRQKQLGVSRPGRHVTLYKMHGDISQPDEAVLVKEDYERYDETRRLFSYQLQGDLVAKTFLFVGFSFTDPNVDYLLSRIRGLMGQDVHQHYCLIKSADRPTSKDPKVMAEHQYNRRRQDLFVGDLKRYGIQAVMIEEYAEITGILEELNRLVYRKNVMVSGSAAEFAPLGQDRLEDLCRALGRAIIEHKHNLTSGFGLGIGSLVAMSSIETVYKKASGRIDERLTLRPFPQEAPQGMTREALWTRYREEMLSQAGSVVFIAGNKRVDGNVVIANGCLEEFAIAKKLKRAPIPIGCTGHAAAQIWQEVYDGAEQFYAGVAGDAREALKVLNDETATNDSVVKAVLALLDLVGVA